MANGLLIRISVDANAPTMLPRIVTPHYEIDHLGLGKVTQPFDPYATKPRIARSFETADPKRTK